MSTLVELPAVAHQNHHSHSTVPCRRSRSIEVIDVDEEYEPGPSSGRRPAQRRRISGNTTNVIDLTNDEPPSPVRSSAHRHSRIRIISPPPPAIDLTVPPVPAFPPEFDLFRPYPLRHSPPPRVHRQDDFPRVFTDVVRPMADPFVFENRIRLSGPPGSTTPRGTPPHGRQTPNNQFGGAILTGHARTGPHGHAHRHNRYHIQFEQAFLPNGGFFEELRRALDRSDAQAMAPAPVAEEEDYYPHYTHPEEKKGNFTYNWAELEGSEEEASSSKAMPIILNDDGEVEETPNPPTPVGALVCSGCMTPFVLGGDSACIPKERRIWGLRCGHMIDGACLEKFSIPIPLLEEESGGRKRKGKGRAYPPDEPSLDSPMRSRLRSSRNSVPGSFTGAEERTSAASFMSTIMPYMPFGYGKNYGKKKPSRPKVQQTHHWVCPVVGCERQHTSVKINDEWGPEKQKGEGPIALFV